MTEQTSHTDTEQPNPTPHEAPADEGHTQGQEGTAEERIAALEEKLAEMEDRWKRSEAENQNLRTRHKRELEDARHYSVQKFARDVVEAAENLQRGLSALPPHEEGEDGLITRLREGFEGTERAFLSILERHGITKQDPTHEPFDANLHQAMQEQEVDHLPPGHVVQAWTPTWLLKDRLLKPAMVIVSNPSSTGQAPKKD
ncbi:MULTISPECIES: nucleotide exchange factor GrpE [Bombella]|uniref:Protein GrpE n=1 Tax=Bombella pollinis TaxID=2967337 RepID=A0ABT3WM60_9PROT|nr:MULTISPECIES: nucleotide exchange factor GrpE [Bombella]MCT6839056.1 nucleotide exchange factor GrpE [Bifidobacteriales bacterium]MCT6855081.1 nucleotide exchange factor GrpE [Bombella apis]MCX5620071.1 nucleotide exchange factor GrpE [Bombella pollinis]MUG05261.1 nucleotide exchange factor GrpE [Bombella sp. ESL0378]MUG90808.1 nucleotide exchange factor GrpE [Bombella sp. ESL0385]